MPIRDRIRSVRLSPLTIAILLVVAIGLSGLAFLAGFEVSQRDVFPARLIVELKTAVKKLVSGDVEVAVVERRRLETATLNLDLVKVRVPIDDPGAGGALTSVGPELLLMSRFGDLFLIRDDLPVRLDIELPDNGFEAYAALAEQEAGEFTHNPDSIRFNDVLFAPGEEAGALVVSYTEWHPDDACYTTTVAQLPVPPGTTAIDTVTATASDWQVVYRTRPCLPLKSMMRAIEGHMAGGRMAFAGDGRVYLGSGDYHWDGVYAPEALAQREDNDYGKVLLVDLRTGTASHVSRGQRNLQGVTLASDGRLWTTEHGPRGGDELNLVEQDGNYGWPLATLGTRYNRLPWPGADYGRHTAFRGPVYAWVPSIGVSNLLEVRGFDPSWDGDLLVASLRGQSLFRLRLVDDRVQFSEQIVIGERIRYVQEHTDGRLVLWTDSEHLVFLSRDDSTPTAAYIEQTIDDMALTPPRATQLREAVMACQECHSFDQAGADGAPTLASVHGRPIAATDFAFYSAALRAQRGDWDSKRLEAYLADPQAAVPGTSMPRPNLPEQTLTDLVELLEALSAAE